MAELRHPAFHVDQAKCTGCKACQIACKDKHDLPEGVLWRRVAEYSGGTWTPDETEGTYRQDVFTYYTSVACNHCANPICVESCPTTAMHVGEMGIVEVDQDKCIGCRYCEMACPYSAPAFNAQTGTMTKCNFCKDRILEGGTPACVESCPSRVLDFGEYDDLVAKYGGDANIAPLPSPDITHPHLLITPHPKAVPSGSDAGRVNNPTEL